MPQQKQTVNYVWISAPKHNCDDNNNAPLSTLDHTALDLAIQNAQKYTDAEFNLWVDFESLDPQTSFYLTSHLYLSQQPNIQLKNLREIPEYVTDPAFQDNSGIEIYAKVDYARVIVLKQCLVDANDGDQIFYTDFDADDIEINTRNVQDVLRTGMAFATTIDGLENGYMAFVASEQTRDFITKLKDASGKAAIMNAKSRKELVDAVTDYGTPKGYQLSDFFAKKMPPMGKKLPPNPIYVECGLN